MNQVFRALVCIAILITPAIAGAMPWTVDYDNSAIEFRARQGQSEFTGRFTKFAAEIDFDPNAPGEAWVRVVISTGSARTGQPDKDGALPTPDWLNASAFPEAVFESTEIREIGPSQYVADGTLTLRDKTMPVSLLFSLKIDGDHASAHGETTLNRLDFGVGGAWPDETMASHSVDVIVDIEANR